MDILLYVNLICDEGIFYGSRLGFCYCLSKGYGKGFPALRLAGMEGVRRKIVIFV